MQSSTLANMISRWTLGCDYTQTSIAGLSFFRRETPTPPTLCLVEPSIVLVVQGEKRMWFGGESFAYNANHFLITSLDVPANSEVVTASAEQPCLGLMLRLDLHLLAELISQNHLSPTKKDFNERGVSLGTVTPHISEPFNRLVKLLNEPIAVSVLAPLIIREIHFRLLLSEQATRLWQIVSVGSQSQRIAKAVDWLKTNYSAPLRVNELAEKVQMSVSTFHYHFRKLTAMSPLQYQKWLRLNEAKRLMLNNDLDATSAAFHVGYESPSQFNREYSRLFGISPKRNALGLQRFTK